MSIGFLIEILVSILRGFLFKSEKAAPYAKWLLRIRDYLNRLFPTDIYPEGQTGDAVLEAVGTVVPVPIEAVKNEAKKSKFNIPWIRNM